MNADGGSAVPEVVVPLDATFWCCYGKGLVVVTVLN